MQVFRRREVQRDDPVSSDDPTQAQLGGDRAPTEHDITLRAMASDVELERLMRLERRRDRGSIWRFAIKTAVLAVAVLVVCYAARGVDATLPEQLWPIVSLVGATAVTALVSLVVARLAGRRDAGAPTDGQSGTSGQGPGGGP